jgi:septin family protein
MKLALVVALALLGACAHGPLRLRQNLDPNCEASADSLYWRAVYNLDPSNKGGTLDSAIAFLDAYLAPPGKPHAKEAAVLRSLARNSQQLARLDAALQQARANADRPRERESDSKARDEESIKEIQRLKDELAKATAELERIKKRLAEPPSKP